MMLENGPFHPISAWDTEGMASNSRLERRYCSWAFVWVGEEVEGE